MNEAPPPGSTLITPQHRPGMGRLGAWQKRRFADSVVRAFHNTVNGKRLG